MSVLEYKIGQLTEGISETKFRDAMEDWFHSVNNSKDSLYPGLISTKYFKRCNQEGEYDGFHVLLREYEPHLAPGSDTSSEPSDPADMFWDAGTSITYLKPSRPHIWFDYTEEKLKEEVKAGIKNTRFLEYEFWKLSDTYQAEVYEKSIDDWFSYVAAHKKRLFEEWVSASYFKVVDQNGDHTGAYAMIFEYDSHEGFSAYKGRRRESYRTDLGDYVTYKQNDPFQYFDKDTVGVHRLWPQMEDLWLRR